ncbi:hypothetical protein [Pararhizobium haloflavum]|uniref:hypothetical protein n=1 Tax=Pararhizobium haloflavum TaxID=2037914 RepID=UPI000C188935|nr:hypothetical protein [Pararhizobium haloflavum]
MEDWNATAINVDGALREIGGVSQPNGYPVMLRKVVIVGGQPSYPASGTMTIICHDLIGFETVQEMRDINGTLNRQTKRTITTTRQAQCRTMTI